MIFILAIELNNRFPLLPIIHLESSYLTKTFLLNKLKMALTRPPYFDPNTGMRYETSCGNTEGWLTKQSEWLKDWRRRYFILKGKLNCPHLHKPGLSEMLITLIIFISAIFES